MTGPALPPFGVNGHTNRVVPLLTVLGSISGRRKDRNMSIPVCSLCNQSGAGIQFNIFSPYGFGTYCVECEEKLKEENSDG